jgi:hypothetical protein
VAVFIFMVGTKVGGIGLSIGAGLSYTLALPDCSQLSLRTRVNQTLYDVSDLNSTSGRVALRRESFAAGRTTTMEPFARLRFDDEQELERPDYGLKLSTAWKLDNGGQLRTSFLGESRTYIDSDATSTPYHKLNVNDGISIGPRTRFGLGISIASARLAYSPVLPRATMTVFSPQQTLFAKMIQLHWAFPIARSNSRFLARAPNSAAKSSETHQTSRFMTIKQPTAGSRSRSLITVVSGA